MEAKPSLKKMKIELDLETGEMHIDGERADGTQAGKRPLTPEEQKEIYDSPNGFKFVGLILHYHMSPGCVVYIGGSAVHLC